MLDKRKATRRIGQMFDRRHPEKKKDHTLLIITLVTALLLGLTVFNRVTYKEPTWYTSTIYVADDFKSDKVEF